MKELEVSWTDGCAYTVSPYRRNSRRPDGRLLSTVEVAEQTHWKNCPVTPKFRSRRMPQPVCSHCARPCGDAEGGWGSLNGEPLCHPSVKGRPDCYTLVTLYHHPLDHQDCPITDGVQGAVLRTYAGKPVDGQ